MEEKEEKKKSKYLIVLAILTLIGVYPLWKWTMSLSPDELDRVVLNNIVYEVQMDTKTQGTLLLIHLDKQS